ncbi:MAG: hypothetical protein V4622_02330 [Bacteroidota bacterium]
MKFLTTLLKYLSYLSPILIKKYSYNVHSNEFVNFLRINTLSPYGDKKNKLRDLRIGRKNKSDSLYMSEYDNLFYIRNSYSARINPYTLIWFTDKTKLKFTKISFPCFYSGFMILSLLFLAICSFFSSYASYYHIIGFILGYLFFILTLQTDYENHSKFIEKALFYNRESFKNRESYE